MKKFLISLTMAFIAICAFAQDMPKFSEFAADTEFYLFNVETKAFLIGANDWGTRASVDVEKGYLTKLTVNGDTYKLEDQTPKGWNELDCNGIGDMWVDGAGRGGAGMWTVTDLGGNKYEIGNTNVAGKLGVNDIAADTRLYMNGANTTWAFVTAEDYAAYIEAAAEEIAKQKQEKLDAANMLAIQARKDLAEKTTVYNQEGYDAYTAKTAELEELIKAGNYTEAVVSPNSTTGWHSSTEYNFLLTPWTIGGEAANNFDKALYINTWSVEGVTDGSNFLVPFFEYWTGDGNSLDANELATTITGLTPNAEYEATAWARVRIKNGGGTEANGITFQAGEGEAANVCDGQAFGQMVVKEVSAKGYADANGELVVKFVVADNNISWLSYKNVAVKATGEIANDSIIYPEVALDSVLTFEHVNGSVVVKVNSVEGLDAVVNDANYPELKDRKLSDFTYMKVKASIFEIENDSTEIALDEYGWYESVADPVTEGDTITYNFKPLADYKVVVNKIVLIDGRNGNVVTDKDYNTSYEFTNDGIYYIANADTKMMFLEGNNSWGTQASVGKAGAQFLLTKLENGAYSIVNTELSCDKKNLGSNLYVDADQPANGWVFNEVQEHIFTIALDGKYLAKSENIGANNLPICELVDEVTEAAKWVLISADNMSEIAKEIAEWAAEDVDVTFLLKNPGFNRNTATDAWIVSEDCTNKNLGGGANENFCAESWQSVFTISQTIAVPNGIYEINAQAALTDYAELYDGANYPVVFANEGTSVFCEMEEGDRKTNMSTLSNSFKAGKYQVEPIIVEVTDGKLTVGVKGTRTDTWCIWDNFQIIKLSEKPVTKPIMIAFDRIAGQGYTGDEIPYNEEEILAALKITSWDQITTMYPANMETGEPAQDYDGWRSPSGSPTAWGDNSYACVKYPHDGSMFLCTMPGNEPKAGTEFNCAWILGTEDNNVCVMITVNFIEAPKFTLPISDLAIKKEVKYELSEGSYAEKKVILSDDEVASICEELNIKSLDEATVYGFNPTDESLLTSYAGFDGWRDGEGNFHNWTGDGNAPACVKYTNGQEYLCYNIGGLTDQTIKTYWAIGNGEKVVLVCIDFVYGTGVPAKDPTGINGIAGQSVKANGKYFENGKVVIYKNGAKYSVSGAALK